MDREHGAHNKRDSMQLKRNASALQHKMRTKTLVQKRLVALTSSVPVPSVSLTGCRYVHLLLDEVVTPLQPRIQPHFVWGDAVRGKKHTCQVAVDENVPVGRSRWLAMEDIVGCVDVSTRVAQHQTGTYSNLKHTSLATSVTSQLE
jgi:hypothetical protein